MRCIAVKVASLLTLSTNPTFEMEKLKMQASEVHQKLDRYSYKEVLLAVRSRQDSQHYVRQVQRAQIFFQQMTTSLELSNKVTNFYSKQKWATYGLTKVVDHVAKLLNDGSKRKFQPLEKFTSLKHTTNDIENCCALIQKFISKNYMTFELEFRCSLVISDLKESQDHRKDESIENRKRNHAEPDNVGKTAS